MSGKGHVHACGAEPDAAGRSFCWAFAEPGMLHAVAFSLADSAPAALCHECIPHSFALLDCQQSQQRVLEKQQPQLRSRRRGDFENQQAQNTSPYL